MAWDASGNYLTMVEGDYGIELPFSVKGLSLSPVDTLRFTFKERMNGNTILEKSFTPSENGASLILTEAESELFTVGNYVYSLDWFNNGLFMCNLIECGSFRVLDKA